MANLYIVATLLFQTESKPTPGLRYAPHEYMCDDSFLNMSNFYYG